MRSALTSRSNCANESNTFRVRPRDRLWEGQRVSEAFEEGNRLLFKAKFRDRETYESHFGPFTGAPVDYPTGHWQIEGQSRFTRVIVNAKGRVWLFYQCYEDIECHSGPGGSGLRKSGDDPQ